MQNIVGTRVHEEILELIDRSERAVILVSPFVQMWPDLKRALARAACRGVSITLITRGPRGRPYPEDLDVFYQLEAEIKEVPVLHLKAYLSEKEGIHTSVNLTRQSVGKSVESSLLFDRERDAEGWAQVYEIWQKVLDDNERANENEPTNIDHVIAHIEGKMPPLRERADAGDVNARDAHRYCIACGKTSSDDADEVICLRCRASAIAEGRHPEDVTGVRCARCNQDYRAKVQYPLCDACFQDGRRRYEQRVARWFVAGSCDAIQSWWRYEDSSKRLSRTTDPRLGAVTRRWLTLSGGRWVSATLTASTTLPVDLWGTASLPSLLDGKAVDGLVLERVPSIRLPPCKELPNFDQNEALHAVYTRHADPRLTAVWAAKDQLAAWDIGLERSKSRHHLAAPDWLWKAILAPRRSFSGEKRLSADRVHLKVEIEIGAPDDLRDKWLNAVHHLLPLLLASLHTYDEDEAKEVVGAGSSSELLQVVQALTMPAPLGPATLVRTRNGKIHSFPSRLDRVVALRAMVVPAEGWHLVASISTAQKTPVH